MQPALLVAGLVAGIGSLGATAGISLAVRAFGNARLLAAAPPTPVEHLEEGLQGVAGVLRAENALAAPLTGRACSYYRLLLEQRRRNHWETVLDQRAAVAAALDDGGGRVVLDLDEADVVVVSPDRVRTGVYAVPSPELAALLAKVDPPAIPPAGPFLRWREEALTSGDRLVAVGAARRADDTWSLHAEADAPFMVSDRDEAEVIRHQRRAGQRWAAVGLVGLGAAAWGFFGLLPLLPLR